MSERRWWLRPKWVFGHLLCLALIITFISCGFWQLRRLDERRERNDLIHAREQAAPTSLENALRAGVDGAVYRRVRTEGTWNAADTVLVRSRSLDGNTGYHVLTPLDTDDGTIVVNRGFTPQGGGGEPAILATVRPKGNEHVRVEGILRASEQRGSFGPKDPSTGRLTVINRIDIARLQEQIDRPLEPVYLQLRSSVPPPGDVPQILPLPATDEGPHLAYAAQWFIFATVGLVGWPLLLRKQSQEQGPANRDKAAKRAKPG